ncbi:MAG: DUF262 domain-containing protein [Porphyrobacter sp.]|nr:DUF262 domain-containing protein [Porphyrobacter sp.]
MASTNFQTENNTYRKLMGNGLVYRIPRFQRDYSWTEQEWEDLWSDILDVNDPNSPESHYMGYLVLQSKDEKTFDVIDGQQRLTTLSILVLSVLRQLNKLIESGVNADENERRIGQIRQTYIGYLDPVTLVAKSKLTLNRNNDNYYQSYIVPLRQLPARGFKASEHSMRKASDWFEKRISEFLKEKIASGADIGVELAKLIEKVSDGLFFTVITVTDELNAYKVFETLNSRGVRLSTTDLLKNYLFSILHKDGQTDGDLDAMEERWQTIVGRLGEENFPDFLRVHWISRNGLVRQVELYKTIRVQISNREGVFKLLQGLDDDLDTYLSMLYPDSSGWTGDTKKQANLLRLFAVRQHLSTTISARRVLNDEDFEKFLRAIVVISFRYNVIGRQQAQQQERIYASVAQRISAGELKSLGDILNAMRPIYISDRAFKTDFAEIEVDTKQTRNRRIVRYILTKIERQLSGLELDPDAESFNIEHILPQNPGDQWDFKDVEAVSAIYRLGNMTLLRKDDNREIDNTSFETKKSAFAASDFSITSAIPIDYADWNSDTLGARQATLANIASGIWRISQFDS